MEINEQHAVILVKRVLESKDNSDRIILVSGIDGKKIPIHRFVLSASSKYFADLVLESDSDIKQQEFVLADSDDETIKMVVDYCYSGNIDLNEQNAANCLQVAVNGEFDLLFQKCHEYFSSKLSVENAVQVLMIADKHNINDLRQRALKLIGSKIDKVSLTNIVQLKHSMMQHLLENGGANELLVERLIDWFQHDEDGRGEHMPKMLRLIQLRQLTAEFLTETIEPVFVQFKCVDLLMKEYRRRAIYCACTPSSKSHPLSPVKNVTPTIVPSETKTVQSIPVEYVDMKSIFIVCVTGPFDTEIVVHKCDKSLNRFTRHFTSPEMNVICFGTVLYANKLFVIGGRCPDRISRTLDSVIAYDLTTGTKEILASMNKPRSHFTSIVMGKWIYVFGGMNEFTVCSSSCERYDTETNKWETIKSMNHTRETVSVAILNGVIYVASRCHNEKTTLLDSYDPKTNKWTVRKPLDVGRNDSQLVVFNGILYGFVDLIFKRYDPEQDEWTKMDECLLFRNRVLFGIDIKEMIAVNDSLFAITNDGTLQRITISKNKIRFDTVANVPDLYGKVSIHRMR